MTYKELFFHAVKNNIPFDSEIKYEVSCCIEPEHENPVHEWNLNLSHNGRLIVCGPLDMLFLDSVFKGNDGDSFTLGSMQYLQPGYALNFKKGKQIQ